MAAALMEEEAKRDSIAKVIQMAQSKCAELAGVDESLEELLSQLQLLATECLEKMKPSKHIIQWVWLITKWAWLHTLFGCTVYCVCVCAGLQYYDV